jgi:hypothetical protein
MAGKLTIVQAITRGPAAEPAREHDHRRDTSQIQCEREGSTDEDGRIEERYVEAAEGEKVARLDNESAKEKPRGHTREDCSLSRLHPNLLDPREGISLASQARDSAEKSRSGKGRSSWRMLCGNSSE